jgi:hypothetical protein
VTDWLYRNHLQYHPIYAYMSQLTPAQLSESNNPTPLSDMLTASWDKTMAFCESLTAFCSKFTASWSLRGLLAFPIEGVGMIERACTFSFS